MGAVSGRTRFPFGYDGVWSFSVGETGIHINGVFLALDLT
jgi:hypothetical protein